MACDDNGSVTLGPRTVWSQKDTTNWLAHALTEPESTTGLAKVRGSIQNASSTGAVKTRIVFRTTNDGNTFDAWTPLYTSGTNEQSNDGTTYGASFIDLLSTVAGKQAIQWGVQTININASTATELTSVTVKLDKRGT